jgi:hypothetical protein
LKRVVTCVEELSFGLVGDDSNDFFVAEKRIAPGGARELCIRIATVYVLFETAGTGYATIAFSLRNNNERTIGVKSTGGKK